MRILAVAHTCIYDAWTAFDAKAVGVHFNTQGEQRLKPSPDTERNRQIAISQAAQACGGHLLPGSLTLFAQVLVKVWPERRPENFAAENLGRAAAAAVLRDRVADGSNAAGELGCRYPVAPMEYCDYTSYEPRNHPALVLDKIDPVRWQPISTGEGYQTPLVPHWGRVKPFSFWSRLPAKVSWSAIFPRWFRVACRRLAGTKALAVGLGVADCQREGECQNGGEQ